MRKIILILSLFLGINIASYASTLNSTQKATATLTGSCQVKANDLVIGSIIAGQPSSSGTSQVSVLCTKGTTYSWYPNFRQVGWDCPFLTGAVSGEKIYYMFKVNGVFQVNTQPSPSGTSASGTGTGDWNNFTLEAYIQPNQSYSPCPRKPTNPGFNPFVTPDNYSDTDTIVLTF